MSVACLFDAAGKVHAQDVPYSLYMLLDAALKSVQWLIITPPQQTRLPSAENVLKLV